MSEAPWQVFLSHRAETYLKRLRPSDQARFRQTIDGLETGPRAAGAKPLHGRPEWSLRVGDWRALLRVDESARAIVLLSIGPRGDVYK